MLLNRGGSAAAAAALCYSWELAELLVLFGCFLVLRQRKKEWLPAGLLVLEQEEPWLDRLCALQRFFFSLWTCCCELGVVVVVVVLLGKKRLSEAEFCCCCSSRQTMAEPTGLAEALEKLAKILAESNSGAIVP